MPNEVWGENPAGLISETQAAVALAVAAERERCVQWLLDIANVYVETAAVNRVNPMEDPVGYLWLNDGVKRHEKLAELLRAEADPVEVFEVFSPK